MKFDDKLKNYYNQLNNNHDQLRDELLAKLPDDVYTGRLEFIRSPLRIAAKFISAAAAVLLVAAGLSMLSTDDFNLNNYSSTNEVATIQSAENLAWAEITELISRPESLHCKMTTFSGRNESSMLFWWQQPNDHRMEFTNGMINAASDGKYYTYNPETKKKDKYNVKNAGYDAVNPSQFILGLMGMPSMFPGWIESSAEKFIDQSQIVSSKEITFKERLCYEIVANRDSSKVEYIIDQFEPTIYKATQYETRNGKEIKVSEIEILELNKVYPETLFKLP
ncbi:MAG: hypothetical protein JEZ07_04135 [Phycisphaerae bacterium]|nr:hypothetical protein [Phycisphaerae bacterium]